MAILVGPETRVICQGMTGRAATFHVGRMLDYGTKVVAGVTPGKGGTRHLDLPVFDTVGAAVETTGGNASLVFVPPPNAADAMIEAIDAQMPLVVCVTERMPLLDMVRVRQALEGRARVSSGPTRKACWRPSIAQLGVMSTTSAAQGAIGIVSRSASLTSEIVAQVTRAGLGQSTTVGIGGDPVHGMSLADCVDLFLDDAHTKGIILIGEIGGLDEEQAAETIARLQPRKPIVALVAGRHAPQLRRMGHAGAFTSGNAGSAAQKIDALRAAGVQIAANARKVGEMMREALAGV